MQICKLRSSPSPRFHRWWDCIFSAIQGSQRKDWSSPKWILFCLLHLQSLKYHTRPNCALLPQGILTKGTLSFLPLDSKNTDHQAAQCHAPDQTFWQLENPRSPEWRGLSHGRRLANPPPVPFTGTWAEEQGSQCSKTAIDPLGTKNLHQVEGWLFSPAFSAFKNFS